MTRSERTGTVVVALLGVALLVAGLVQVRTGEVSFGWFAYAPLPETVYAPAPPSWRLGLVLVVAGTLALGGAGGFAVGRRGRGTRRDTGAAGGGTGG
ncbi:hypothetical protein GC089_00725 [Cellulomonas sp. JZ18]|uniref:hypothetical protein n=1 Tax=Cellulomonas sp. JZ18 TaxID=2654191 RepID=UPI0012D4146A|nr:hypothetical protein [Cellulomonas sp. JZ18]QGQ18061.1 hypothetical protein GC089_00725 [Cellulomonas sp. JZ18]